MQWELENQVRHEKTLKGTSRPIATQDGANSMEHQKIINAHPPFSQSKDDTLGLRLTTNDALNEKYAVKIATKREAYRILCRECEGHSNTDTEVRACSLN